MNRRTLMASLMAGLGGCAQPLPPLDATGRAPDAQALLNASAAAHGFLAFTQIADLSAGYTGHFHPLVSRLQPVLADASFRGGSEERLLLRGAMLVGQAHGGPAGHKQVARQMSAGDPGEVQVWYNGTETQDPEARAAAALVADDYSLFLLGPMLLTRFRAQEHALVLAMGDPVQITVGDRAYLCDILRARLHPGQGFAEIDDVALYIDRDERLMRRVRFSVNGLASTRGAVAEVDAWDHITRRGISWPTRFQERLLRPFPLAVHDWQLTGLDVDRGFAAADIMGPVFTGLAVSPAGSARLG